MASVIEDNTRIRENVLEKAALLLEDCVMTAVLFHSRAVEKEGMEVIPWSEEAGASFCEWKRHDSLCCYGHRLGAGTFH